MPSSLQTRKKKKISANFNILKEDYTSPDDIDTTDNAGDLEWESKLLYRLLIMLEIQNGRVSYYIDTTTDNAEIQNGRVSYYIDY